MSAAEFRNRESVVLFTDRHGKDAKMCALLLTTTIYIICYAFAVSAVIFYFVYVPLFLGKAALYLIVTEMEYLRLIQSQEESLHFVKMDVFFTAIMHLVICNWKDSQERALLIAVELWYS